MRNGTDKNESLLTAEFKELMWPSMLQYRSLSKSPAIKNTSYISYIFNSNQNINAASFCFKTYPTFTRTM